MAKDKAKPKEKSSFLSSLGKSERKEKKLNISPRSIVDNMVFSKTDVYAYYRLSNDVFDFLSNDQKISLGLKTTNALNNLMSNRQDPLDGHIVQTSLPFDVDAWAQQMLSVSENWNTGPRFEDFLDEQFNHLAEQEYMKKVTYIGLHLGKRGALDSTNLNFLEVGLRGAFDTLKEWAAAAAQTPSDTVSAAEEVSFRRKEQAFSTILSTGNLRASRATTEELLLLIKRQFHPYPMPVPYLNVDPDNRVGPGDLELESASVIENKWRWLKMTQMVGDVEMSGYRATLSFAKFPRDMHFPVNFPFFYLPSRLSLPVPFTLYSRFTLFPSAKIKKDIEKKRKEQKDEFENIVAGQDSFTSATSGMPEDFSQALHDVQEVGSIVASDKTAWIEGSYRMCVEAPDENFLKEICAVLQQTYEDEGITLLWTAGDQKTLFLEQMPGDHHRMKSFKQITTLNMVGTSGFNFSSDIGDPTFGDPTSAK